MQKKKNQHSYLQVGSKIISHAQLEVTFVHKYLCSSYSFAPNRVHEENTSFILLLLLLPLPHCLLSLPHPPHAPFLPLQLFVRFYHSVFYGVFCKVIIDIENARKSVGFRLFP